NYSRPPRSRGAQDRRLDPLEATLLSVLPGETESDFTWRYFDESTGMAPKTRRVRQGFFPHPGDGALLLDQNDSGASENLSLVARSLCPPATQQLAAGGRQLPGVRRKATHSVPRV